MINQYENGQEQQEDDKITIVWVIDLEIDYMSSIVYK